MENGKLFLKLPKGPKDFKALREKLAARCPLPAARRMLSTVNC